MLQDWLGNAVSTDDEATLRGIDDFIIGVLAYERRAANIIAAAEADPDCALANAYAAMLHMLLESRAALAPARRCLARAEQAASGVTERERMVIAAARAWIIDDDIPRAIAIGEAALAAFPTELAIAKICQYHQFNLGDAPGMLRVAHLVGAANDDVAWVHGLTAFAFEECHALKQAEAAARAAVARQRKEPWAHHALAHVLLTEGRIAEGRAFLEDVRETWTGLNSFMLTHNWWHLALFMIEQGDAEAVLDFYDRTIWGVWKEYSQDQIGAVSLLSRLELAGIDVGDRWQDVGAHLAVRVDDHVQPFLSMQYLYGLARAGRPEAAAMLAAIRAHAAQVPGFWRATWQEVCLPACEGLLAHAQGDHETALARLGPVLPRLGEIGGSHAQRDLFEQIALDAMIRTDRLAAAQRVLALRHAASPRARPTQDLLALVYRRLGLDREAAALDHRRVSLTR